MCMMAGTISGHFFLLLLLCGMVKLHDFLLRKNQEFWKKQNRIKTFLNFSFLDFLVALCAG